MVKAAERLGYSLQEKQRDVIVAFVAFVGGRDRYQQVVVKACVTVAFDRLRQNNFTSLSIVIVVSPLVVLMIKVYSAFQPTVRQDRYATQQ